MGRTVAEWLAYIEAIHPHNIELGLERVQTIADRLSLLPVIPTVFTVAGTNGKGSTATFLSSILRTSGYKTALYTSPHLLCFNERICIDGQSVSDEVLVNAFEKIEEFRRDIILTYFEFTTLSALYIFSQAHVDVWILEVGLGGRLDAVNIVDPDIAIVTTIAMDHMDWLGHDREQIGREKAGIIRAGRPVVCGDPQPTHSLLEVAQGVSAPLYCLNKDFSYTVHSDATWSFQAYQGLPLPALPVQNAATALMALSLSHLHCDQAAIAHGLKTARLMGRFQTLHTPFYTIVDVAHNPQATAYLADRLRQLSPCLGKTKAIVGMLADKDIENSLRPLLSCVDEWYTVDLCVPRGECAEKMANHLQRLGVTAYHKGASVVSTYHHVVETSSKLDRILVFGSFHTVADILVGE